jgi:PPP family 3-phenylpropionic acid transporter
VGLIAATNWLHALSFGATHLAAIGYLQRHVPHHRSATAQSLLSALTTGVAMATMTALSGELYGRIGADVFWAMAAVALLGGVLAFTLLQAGPRRSTDLSDAPRPDRP